MAVVIRWVSAILAVLMGLPLLLSSVFQSLLKVGYDERPTQAISENFLEGNVDFIDEAVADSWSAGYAKRLLTPDDARGEKFFSLEKFLSLSLSISLSLSFSLSLSKEEVALAVAFASFSLA